MVLEKYGIKNIAVFVSNSPGFRYFNSDYAIGVEDYYGGYLDIAVSDSKHERWSLFLLSTLIILITISRIGRKAGYFSIPFSLAFPQGQEAL
jgi:hypothetical protein